MLVFHGIFWDPLVNCHWIARGNHDVPRLAGYKKTSAKLPGAVQMSFRSIAHGNFLSVSDTQKAPEVAPGKGILIVVELHLQDIDVILNYICRVFMLEFCGDWNINNDFSIHLGMECHHPN